MSGSWVTMTTVIPSSRLRPDRSRMISSLIAVSRFPVGSSARMMAGRVTIARAMATRCCWPPESSFGAWSARSARPTLSSASRARRRRSVRRHPAVKQRQLDILQRRGAGKKIEALEDEADEVAAEQRTLIAVELADVDSVEAVGPAGRRIEAAEDVHRRRLAGTARPHDGDELAAVDREVDAAKRRDHRVALAVELGHPAECDQRSSAASRSSIATALMIPSGFP